VTFRPHAWAFEDYITKSTKKFSSRPASAFIEAAEEDEMNQIISNRNGRYGKRNK
jgi:hypothetical protein